MANNHSLGEILRSGGVIAALLAAAAGFIAWGGLRAQVVGHLDAPNLHIDIADAREITAEMAILKTTQEAMGAEVHENTDKLNAMALQAVRIEGAIVRVLDKLEDIEAAVNGVSRVTPPPSTRPPITREGRP